MRPRTHNLISYSLALVVFMAAIALRRSSASDGPPVQAGALMGAVMWSVHFVRRTAEAAGVHRYSKPRVPLLDLLIEYVYYGGFAAWNAATLFSSDYRSASGAWLALGALVFTLGEIGNAKSHRMLRDLRPAGSNLRRLPRGFLFEYVSCPHYLFEIITWIGFAMATQTRAALAFLLLGAAILGAWARTRHNTYRAEFDGQNGRELYPRERRALIPGVF